MTPTKALKMTEKFQFAISLLTIHGLLSDAERDRARQRLDKWAAEHNLKRKVQS